MIIMNIHKGNVRREWANILCWLLPHRDLFAPVQQFDDVLEGGFFRGKDSTRECRRHAKSGLEGGHCVVFLRGGPEPKHNPW